MFGTNNGGLPPKPRREWGHFAVPVAQKPLPLRLPGWAWTIGRGAKGNDGTILWDLERRCVIDLLPDRQSNTVTEWLRDHAPPEVVSRDRAGGYAEAVRQGAPQAVQDADQFQLLCNLREALEHVVARHGQLIEEAVRQATPLPCATYPPTPPSNLTPTRPQQISRLCR